jgi:hypothetical protein
VESNHRPAGYEVTPYVTTVEKALNKFPRTGPEYFVAGTSELGWGFRPYSPKKYPNPNHQTTGEYYQMKSGCQVKILIIS